MKARGVFITGTDTGVGKTLASCALLQALRAAGLRATGMKPVAGGCTEAPEGLRSEDALALTAASNPPPANYGACNPYALREAVSPHIAAVDMDIEIAIQPIQDGYDTLALEAEAVVVEGVGGWLAPLSRGMRANAIPQMLQLPVILVVGLKLGCLNHAQLTARAIHGDGCELIGWIGNRIDPGMLHPKENLASLQRLMPAPCLGVLPHGIDAVSGAASLRDAADAIRALRG